MTISERATASITPIQRDPSDLGRLREEWRLASEDEIAAEDLYDRLSDGQKIFLDELIETLIEQNDKIAANKAERTARTSERYKDYMRRKHDARLVWRKAQLETKNKDRAYWEQNSREATERSERRMSR